MILGSFETSRNIAIAGLGDDWGIASGAAPTLDTGSAPGSSDSYSFYNPISGPDTLGIGLLNPSGGAPLPSNYYTGANPNTQPYGTTPFTATQGGSALNQGAGSNSWWQGAVSTGAGIIGKAFGLNPQAPKPPASSMLVPVVLLLGAGAVAVFIFTRKPRRRAYA